MMVEAAVEEERRAELRTEAHTSINRSDEDLTAAGYRRAAGRKPWTANGYGPATRPTHLCPRSGREQDDQNGKRPAATHNADYSSAWISYCQIGRHGTRQQGGLRIAQLTLTGSFPLRLLFCLCGRLFLNHRFVTLLRSW